MPHPTHELVEELQRLKPGSPVLHHFRDVADGIEWWNTLEPTERGVWLQEARSAVTPNPSAADAWDAFKRRRAFTLFAHNVVALIERGERGA